MTAVAQKWNPGYEPFTVATFDVFLEGRSDARLYELVDGIVYMMSNPNDVHEQIVSNIGAPLKLAMDKRDCRTFMGGMRVQRSDKVTDKDKPSPDVIVRCGPNVRKNYVTDALVAVEVLSPSTMDIDRGRKLEFYQSLPTICHIALVYQDQMRVEHYKRATAGWELEVLTTIDENLLFDAVEFAMPLATIYAAVPL